MNANANQKPSIKEWQDFAANAKNQADRDLAKLMIDTMNFNAGGNSNNTANEKMNAKIKHTITVNRVPFTIESRSQGTRHTITISAATESGTLGVEYGFQFFKLKEALKRLQSALVQHSFNAEFQKARKASYQGLTNEQKFTHQNFAYGRFYKSEMGNYITIYWLDSSSPTGVSSVGGCSEAELRDIEARIGKSLGVLSPTEDKRTAR